VHAEYVPAPDGVSSRHSNVLLSDAEKPIETAVSLIVPDGAEVIVTTGATVSIRTARADDAADGFPAASVAVALTECVPSARLVSVAAHPPDPFAVADERGLPPTSTVIVALGSAVPETPTLEVRKALPSAGAVRTGAAGATVSTRTVRAADGCDALIPDAVAIAVKLWVPSDTPVTTALQSPVIVAVPDPRAVEPSYSVTVAPGSAVPEKLTLGVRLQPPSAGELMTGVEA
jgi:hypothetical protein